MTDISDLRRKFWADGMITPDEAERLFAESAAANPGDTGWTDFFVEAVTEYLIQRGDPKGYVTDADADWLIARLDADGRLDSAHELEALVHLFERAERVPDKLRSYGIAQIEQAVLTGAGPTRSGAALDPGCVNAAECKLLRRMLFSAGGDAPARISRAEAEALLRIKDASLGKANAPEWKTLFVQALANHLITDAAQPELDRATAVRLDRFMSDHRVQVGRFVTQMISAALHPSRIRDALEEPAAPPLAPGAGGFTPDERNWVDAKVAADHAVDDFEQALLAHLAAE
ncbi:MAG: hypothetical protein ABIS38_04460 [Sphingomicrobium sp.]